MDDMMQKLAKQMGPPHITDDEQGTKGRKWIKRPRLNPTPGHALVTLAMRLILAPASLPHTIAGGPLFTMRRERR